MKRKKVAVIGSGISGISASLFLSKKYDVHLFEKNNYLGGHTRTKTLEENTKEINNLKEDVSEIKDMLQQLLSKHGN